MPNFNKVILAGNMVRDPELKYTQGGTAVAEFGIAINRRWEKDGQKQEEVTYVDCNAWARTAEVICEFFTKGKPILAAGAGSTGTFNLNAGGTLNVGGTDGI